MYLYEMKYRHTVYVRKPSDNWSGETDFSHKEVQQLTMIVVVPEMNDAWREAALRYLSNYGGHARDENFEFIGFERTAPVTAILRSALTRV